MLHEIFWAVVALAVLGLMLMLGLARSPYDHSYSRWFSLDDLFEEGVFFAAFVVVFMIVALPLYPLYLLGQVVWRRFYPPLPVEGDDPLWGRNVNRKVAEAAFLAVQHAWMQRNPEGARALMDPSLYPDLKRECERLAAQHEINTRQHIQVEEITLCDEKINKAKPDEKTPLTYTFHGTIRGTMTNFITDEKTGEIKAGASDPKPFEEGIYFARYPDGGDRWLLIGVSGWPYDLEKKSRTSRRKRRRRAAEAAASAT